MGSFVESRDADVVPLSGACQSFCLGERGKILEMMCRGHVMYLFTAQKWANSCWFAASRGM
jgi:hypothetical protein